MRAVDSSARSRAPSRRSTASSPRFWTSRGLMPASFKATFAHFPSSRFWSEFAVMLEIPLTLRSQPGRGSVFKLSVALAPLDQPIPAQAIDVPSGTLNPRFIVVVDDEVAIQDAMRTLLTAWGHCVVVAGSCNEMLERIADCSTRPDLVISDYRLRGEENGIDAIQRLRSEFNDDIPGILITGDTAPGRSRTRTQPAVRRAYRGMAEPPMGSRTVSAG